MFTPEFLLDLASRSDAASHGVPPRDAQWLNLRRVQHQAMLCGAWMETRGIRERACVGPFTSFIPKRGERVRIRKGAVIESTHAKLRRTLTRPYVVTVHRVSEGHAHEDGNRVVCRHAEITWAGSGGYWCWTDLNNVEPYEGAA